MEGGLDRAAELHRDSIVIDSLGPAGPAVYSRSMLARLDELVAAGAPPGAITDELDRLAQPDSGAPRARLCRGGGPGPGNFHRTFREAVG